MIPVVDPATRPTTETERAITILRKAIDDEALTRTGHSLGDLASSHIAAAGMVALADAGYRVLKRNCSCPCIVDTVVPEGDFKVELDDDEDWS